MDAYVRLRDDEYEEKLTAAGAMVIMPENLEPSLQLAAQVLKNAGRPVDEITQTVNEFRTFYRNNQSDAFEPERTESDDDTNKPDSSPSTSSSSW